MAIIDGKLDFNSTSLTSDSTLMTDTIVALEEPGTKEAVDSENLELQGLVAHVTKHYHRAKNQRQYDETRWLEAFDNYRGNYSNQVEFREQEKSRAFIKITKTKVLASYAQILDIIFAANKFPIGIEPSPIPMGIAEAVHFDPESAEEKGKQMGGGTGGGGGGAPKPSPTVARVDILQALGGLKSQLEPIKDMLKEGPGLTPTSQTWEPAKEAAKLMERQIHDQLHEADASKSMRNVIFDMCLFGTGLMKGPFALDKEYPKWDESGKYSPLFNTIADVQHVSIWDAYPDPDAKNINECEYFIQRHKMSKTQIRALKRRPHFRPESIEEAIKQGTNYNEEYWEQSLQDSTNQSSIERYEVLEFWGIIDEEIAEECDLDIPKDLRDRDQIQINAWVCNNQLLRVVLNPFTPARIPFFACPYELNPYSFFGVGVAENMTDTQLLMNGFIRLAVDNATLSSNIIFEIDETHMVPGQDMKLYPGKIFRRTGGQPGQSIFATKFPNVTQECLAMFDKARQLADEATGMPSYAHGQAGITGIGRTASGMSMLMGAAKENIKAVVRNLDDYLFVPLGKGMFAFNMQFNFDKKFLGDVEIVARGTESLMRNEIRSQKLMQFLQIGSNPMDAPYIKRDYILRELATSLDLEADKTVNDPREAAIQAKVIADMNKAMGIEAPQPGMGAANPAAAPGAGDPTQTGGGNVAPGAAPPPGAEGFSGSAQPQGPVQ